MTGAPNGAGVLAGVGPARQSDLAAFASARLNLVRLRAQVNSVEDVAKWRAAGAETFVLQLLSPLPAQRSISPQVFMDLYSREITAFLSAGVTLVEVHDEPNRADRGAACSWQDGAGFSMWFQEIMRLMRQRFGDDLRIGFPALAPSDAPHPEPIAPIDELTFLSQCADALEAADWAALHIYWRTLDEMRAFDGAMRFLREYVERFPDQTFMITEFANVSVEVSARVRGSQYAEFLTAMAQYDRLVGASAYLLRSRESRFHPLAWMGMDGRPRDIISVVGERPQLPKPEALSMTWPTDVRTYLQSYGEHQQRYFDLYRLTGGHNGVDLAVASDRPSPVRAALAGTVVQVALDATGYHRHVRVRSYSLTGEEVTLLYGHLAHIEVTVGMLVAQGDLLGWVGPASSAESPHLHFGLQIRGVRLPHIRNGLNPRPYLNTANSAP